MCLPHNVHIHLHASLYLEAHSSLCNCSCGLAGLWECQRWIRCLFHLPLQPSVSLEGYAELKRFPLFPREEGILAKLQLWQQEKAREGKVSWQLLRRAAGSRTHEEHGEESAARQKGAQNGQQSTLQISVLDPYWQKTDLLYFRRSCSWQRVTKPTYLVVFLVHLKLLCKLGCCKACI